MLDDRGTIVLNSKIDHPIADKEFFNPLYYSFSGEESWRPLATFSYYAMERIFGKSPAAMRTPQWVAHVLIGFMLFSLALSSGFTELAASWAAAFFWLQPANIETLMCVSFNEEVLVALGLLWAFLSKETAIVFLPLVFLHDFLTDKRWKSASLYRWLGSVDIALGKFRRADYRFSQAIQLDPADGYSYDIMTYQWATKGDWEKSVNG